MISVKFPSFGKLSKIHGIFDGGGLIYRKKKKK